MAGTRGTEALRTAGVEHRLLVYAYRDGGGAEQAAADLGVEPERMLKSLVARAGGGLVFALVPTSADLSLRKLASAAGVKAAAMADPRDAERATGYHVGGMSPLGSRRAMPVYLERAAASFERVCVNAGGRGRIVELRASDLIAITGATVADLAA